jgi:cell wall-associated NlpC family hydrolase
VYAQPSTASKELAKLEEGQDVGVVAETEDGKWMRLALEGKYGYAKAAKLTGDKPKEEAETPTYEDDEKGSASGTIEKVIALAVEQYGKKYVYATHGPDTFDCSGLTSYCYGTEAGVSLSRSAYGQGYDSRFAKVESIAALRRGDVVCFDTVESDVDLSDHVGIYLGGGKFIHASSNVGRVVVSSLSSGYYERQFSWGLRVVD